MRVEGVEKVIQSAVSGAKLICLAFLMHEACWDWKSSLDSSDIQIGTGNKIYACGVELYNKLTVVGSWTLASLLFVKAGQAMM